MPQDLPVACSLDGRTLAGRQAELRVGVLAEADALERLPDGYRWSFRGTDTLFARLGPFIDAERRCCRFLRFAIIADPDQGSVSLTVTGPAGTADFLESWPPGIDTRPRDASLLRTFGIFVCAALLEIAGCFAFWAWLRQGRRRGLPRSAWRV